MKHTSKKLIAIILIVAMALSLTVFATANPDSTAGIVFDTGDLPADGVYCASDPTLFPVCPTTGATNPVADPAWGLTSLTIDFGIHSVPLTDTTFISSQDAGDPEEEFLDVVIVCMLVSAWEVDVRVRGFESTTLANMGNGTLNDFELTLVDEDSFVFDAATQDIDIHTTSTPLEAHDTNFVGLSTVRDFGDSYTVAEGNMGVFGASWDAELDVLGGSGHVGAAQTLLRWTFVAL